MLFSSTVFIFLFLPLTLLAAFIVRREYRNLILLIASLIFYAWGEREYAVLMFVSVFFNYLFGIMVERGRERGNPRYAIILAVVFNLGLLAVFKYLNFVVDNMAPLLMSVGVTPLKLSPIHMPIGISFFTFHSLSYVIDIYRGKARANHSPVDIALYISMFPQLVAGPIIRYHDIADQLSARVVNFGKFASGVRRFILGLGKKVLIANTLAVAVDAIFAIPSAQMTTGVAWLGAVGYMLQIYYDFSGYSDMAIGLGRMIGFEFLENFNYPYVSRSIQEFWRRWHISLSNFFRDYLYIPLGGNRRSPVRTYINLLIVFFLTGLWHGASWTFVAWGLFHGTFLLIERAGFRAWLDRVWRPVGHIYAISAVLVGWVFFRADNFPYALGVIKSMVGIVGVEAAQAHGMRMYLSNDVALALMVGIIFSAPIFPAFARYVGGLEGKNIFSVIAPTASVLYYSLIFIISISSLASGTYNPFIYFRF